MVVLTRYAEVLGRGRHILLRIWGGGILRLGAHGVSRVLSLRASSEMACPDGDRIYRPTTYYCQLIKDDSYVDNR